jgi:hypothetical protein
VSEYKLHIVGVTPFRVFQPLLEAWSNLASWPCRHTPVRNAARLAVMTDIKIEGSTASFRRS